MIPDVTDIIFDFDGTLADTTPAIVSTMHLTIAELGLPPKSVAECRATIGLRLEDIPGVLWPGLHDVGSRYASTYRRIFDEKKHELRARTYPGVAEGLRSLHEAGYGMAVASSRSHKSLVEYLNYFGIAPFFSDVVGGNDVARGKPHPDPVLAVCAHTGWLPARSLVVGDAVYDIEMGHNAGALTCGVTYGNQTEQELRSASPAYLVDSFARLTTLLMP